MAKKKKTTARRKTTRKKKVTPASNLPAVTAHGALRPGLLITFRRGAADKGVEMMSQAAGVMSVASSSDYSGAAAASFSDQGAEVLLLDKTGIAIVDVDDERAAALQSASGEAILAVEPEPIFIAYGANTPLGDDGRIAYLQGFRDATNHLYDAMVGEQPTHYPQLSVATFQDSNSFTWGLQAIGVDQAPLSGKGVKVAVLDTGMDLDHPDFQGRTIVHESFIRGQGVQDDNGHGTHCVGTACGPRNPSTGRGYGVAYEADILVGKVLSNQGSSLGRSTVSGIEWAIAQGADIVSLSLGSSVKVGQGFSHAFEQQGQIAKENGVLLVAAAGNDSRRSVNQVEAVGSPANCPSFMAVAAVDRLMGVADFSNAGLNGDGGEIDLAAPGVEVYSSAPNPAAPRQPPFFRQWRSGYDTIGGTSMATPHVAGVAALLKQANPQATPDRIKQMLRQSARKLQLTAIDVGEGLLQAPQTDPADGAARIRVFG